MRFWVGLTDRDWFDFLAHQPNLEEVNFWQPSARKPVNLSEGAPFLFKLHKPQGGWIVGGGYWAHFTTLPPRLAWDVFGAGNGAPTFDAMAARIRKYRPDFDVHADQVGCVALVEPFFLERQDWIESPPDWKFQVQVGKTYDSDAAVGAHLWQQVVAAQARAQRHVGVAESDGSRYGSPASVAPRLGQGAFRALVLDAYERRCAVTGERTLPVLEAAHIKPYSKLGPHSTENGLLLRSDLHTLFDRGYVTVTSDLEFRVSRRIREEFENGRNYYALDRERVRLPAHPYPQPSASYLEWHADEVFRG